MRWDNLLLTAEDEQPAPQMGMAGSAASAGLASAGMKAATVVRPLLPRGAVARTFDTPGFAGMTFYEIHARSIVNKVPEASRVPFRWTVNPYRGCSHACRYCFARNTHTYLDLDAGHDFDSKVVVKVNAGERLRAELAAPGWRGEHIAVGANVDCYQRAEGRYQLMRPILEVLRDAANPFSILTKGTLILRDLDLLEEAAQVTTVRTAVSVGFIDDEIWRQVEPGTPHPRRRLEACATLNDHGIGCGVLMAPILPFLTDSPATLAHSVRQIAEAGATSVTPIVLHLRPGAREWYMSWLAEHHPGLVERYRALYRGGSYAPKAYQERICAQIRDLAAHRHIGTAPSLAGPTSTPAPPSARSTAGPLLTAVTLPTAFPPDADPLSSDTAARPPTHPATPSAGTAPYDAVSPSSQPPFPRRRAAITEPGEGAAVLDRSWRIPPPAQPQPSRPLNQSSPGRQLTLPGLG